LPGGGLLEFYKSQGLQVRHLAFTDYQRPSPAELASVLAAFDELPRAVLIHCSAGIDRTTPAAGFICDRRDGSRPLDPN
jgi:protein-tyrosine phosphatase